MQLSMQTTGAELGGARFFQLGYVVADIGVAVAGFIRTYGATCKDLTRDVRDPAGAESMIQNLAHLLLKDAEIELIEPRRGWISIYAADPQQSVPQVALHHIGYLANDDAEWDAAHAILSQSGAEAAMVLDIPQVRLVYFDTRAVSGHFTELVQRR